MLFRSASSVHHYSHHCSLCQLLCTSPEHKGQANCRPWRLFVRDLLRRYRFIMLKRVGLQDMLCFCVCYSCTRLHMHLSGNNLSRHFGIHIIWRSSFSSLSTLMLRDVLCAIPMDRIVRWEANCFGIIVLDMKDGD